MYPTRHSAVHHLKTHSPSSWHWWRLSLGSSATARLHSQWWPTYSAQKRPPLGPFDSAAAIRASGTLNPPTPQDLRKKSLNLRLQVFPILPPVHAARKRPRRQRRNTSFHRNWQLSLKERMQCLRFPSLGKFWVRWKNPCLWRRTWASWSGSEQRKRCDRRPIRTAWPSSPTYGNTPLTTLPELPVWIYSYPVISCIFGFSKFLKPKLSNAVKRENCFRINIPMQIYRLLNIMINTFWIFFRKLELWRHTCTHTAKAGIFSSG